MAESYVTKREEKGTVNISEEVIAAMVAAAVSEVEGVTAMGSPTTPELLELFGRKNPYKGLKIRFVDDVITIDLLVNVRASGSVTDVAVRVQDAVCTEVESVTGMNTVVNVHVTGISFDKQ